MPVLLYNKTYIWLKKLGVFKAEPTRTSQQEVCEVPYDQEIYLQNGYSIGVAVRKFVKPYSNQYQQLLRVRKIATLKSSQNWQIIEPYLSRMGCDSLNGLNQEEQEVQISTAQIADILQFLYDKYSFKEEEKLKLASKARNNYVDIHNFNPNKPLSDIQNTIEFMCVLLVRNLSISLGEALGLLMDKSKYLKKLIVEGSKKDQFQSILSLYEDFISSWSILSQFLTPGCKDLQKIMEALSEGVKSEKKQVAHLALTLLSNITDDSWFQNYGYYKLLSSNYIECFFFTIQKLSPNYEKILNESLHIKIQDKGLLLTILHNLLKAVPKSIYSKEIFTGLPLSYYYEQCYTVLNRDEIDDQPPKLVIKAKQVLAGLMTTYVDKIPNAFVKRILDTFQYNGNRSYGQTYFNLGLLFEVLEAMMLRESPLLERFFKVCMKYLGSTFGETRHWIIDNLRYLYQKTGKSYPLGCMLAMYSLDAIGQADQYSLFYEISQDRNNLSFQQSALTISYLVKYIQSQIHCKCFLTILKLFLANHPKSSSGSVVEVSMNLLNKMQQINIPMLNQGQVNILNPKPPLKSRVINSIGMKRKEMMKFAEYELGQQLLQIFATLKDREFLIFYIDAIGHTILEVEKQIGHKKKELVNLLKEIRGKARKSLEQFHEPEPMSEIVKSIVINRSTISNGLSYQQITPQLHTPLSQSKLIEDGYGEKSELVHPIHRNSIISEQQEREESQNEFIPEATAKLDTKKYQKLYECPDQLATEAKPTDFTNDVARNEDFFIYCNPVLEHCEIGYISAQKTKYQSLISHCQQIYSELAKTTKNNQDFLVKFLAELGLSRMLTPKMAQQILDRCKILDPSELQLVPNFLIQSSFHVFAFKQNRRITVTCINSFFTILNENLKEKKGRFGQSGEKIKNSQDSLLTKNVVFEYRVDRRLRENIPMLQKSKRSMIQSYIVCFEVLSELLTQKLMLPLVQPFSTQVNQFKPKLESAQTRQSMFPHQNEVQQQSEVEMLEHLIDESEREVKNKGERGYRVKKRVIKKAQTQSVIEASASGNTGNRQLRNKLAKRLKILNEDLVKNGKNLSTLIQGKATSDDPDAQIIMSEYS